MGIFLYYFVYFYLDQIVYFYFSIIKWIADKVSGWGDHYQFIALKSVLKQAVSKPVLAGQGLVSCLDYYLDKHEVKIGLNRRMPNGTYGGVRGARN